MKKVDVRITITDNNGEDSVLAMFVPVINGDEYEESESLIEEISKFINNNIINKAKKPSRVMYKKPIWRKSILGDADDYKPESFYKENFMETSFGERNIYDEPSLFPDETSLFPKERISTVVRPNLFGIEEHDFETKETIPTINFLSLGLYNHEKTLIYSGHPLGTLRFNIQFNKENIYRNNINYKIIDSNMKKVIIEKSKYDEYYIQLLENNTLYATSEDAHLFNAYLNNHKVSNELANSIPKKRSKAPNAETKQKTMVIGDYRETTDTESTVLIYSARGALFATNKQEKFKTKIKNSELQKITNIVDKEKHYIDFGTIDLTVDLYITDDALKTIMGRFNLTYSGLKESVFSYIFCPNVQKKLLIK